MPLLNCKLRKHIPTHVSRLTSNIKAEGSASQYQQGLITFAQHSSLHRPFRMGGTVYRLCACYLLFIFLIFTSSHFTLSIAQTWFSPLPISHGGEWLSMMIIYHAEAFLKRKEKYILFFYLFLKERPLSRVVWEILDVSFEWKSPRTIVFVFTWSFLGPKNHYVG